MHFTKKTKMKRLNKNLINQRSDKLLNIFLVINKKFRLIFHLLIRFKSLKEFHF